MISSESLLFDSQVWLWLVWAQQGVMNDAASKMVRSAVSSNRAAISDITFWELALKARKGKLDLPPDPRTWLKTAKRESGVNVIEVDRNLLVDSALLDAHPDPADRVIIATAQRYGLRLATADEDILAYSRKNRKLRVLDVQNG